MFARGRSLQQPDSGEDPAEFSVPCDGQKPGTACQHDQYDTASYSLYDACMYVGYH